MTQTLARDEAGRQAIESLRLAFVFPLLCAALLLVPGRVNAQPGGAAGPTPPLITAVLVQGNLRVAQDRIIGPSGLKAGQALDPATVREGIERLYRGGQFASIEVRAETVAEGARVIIHVKENPLLEEITYEGNDKIKEDDLKEKTTLAVGDVVSERMLWESSKGLVDLYKEKGHILAQVTPKIDTPMEGRAKLTYVISEGKKVRVKKITVSGVSHFDPGDVEGAMKTKEDRWWRGGDFKKEIYEEDLTKVEAYLKDRGYADARVISDTVWTDANGRDIMIEIRLEEGPSYTVGSVAAEGSEILDAEKLVAASDLRTGRVYSEKEFEEGVSNVYALFAEEGYIYTNVVPEKTKREAVIDVRFFITDGPPAHVNKVFITGNTKTKERVIRRELAIYPGDRFRRSALMRSQREIFQLGYFQDVQLQHEAVRGTNDINLTFQVEEKQTGQASMGAGFSSQNGATGFLRLGETNLFGNGQRGDILWEFGNLTQVELSFTEPWLYGTRTSAGANIAVVRRNLDTFYDIRRGGGVHLGRPIPWLDYSRIDWRYRLEKRELEARAGASPEVIAAQGSDLISSMRLTFYRSSTDRPFHPTSGTATVLSSELAGGPLGGEIEYHQHELESRNYFPSFWRCILLLRGRIGVLDGLDDPDEVPIYELYRLGGTGPYGLRGYGDRDVVPEGNSVDVGGRSMVVLSAEYKVRIVESIFALGFADAGNTWNSFREVRLGELRRGVGFGVRFEIPLLGQMGFDLGYGFDQTDSSGRTQPGWEPHFQLGSLF